MQTGIYAIIDNVADAILRNNIWLERTPMAAIRTFTDIATDTKTIVGMHPVDHDLVCLGYLTEQNTIEPSANHYDVIITGKAWLASQIKPETDAPQENHLRVLNQ